MASEAAALHVEAGQAAVDLHILGVLLPGLFENPHGDVEQTERVGGLGHVHLGAAVPGIAAKHLLAVLQHLEVITRTLGALDAGLGRRADDEGQPAAAKVILVFALFQMPQQPAVDEIGGIDLAAVHHQMNGVIEIAAGDDLLGALILPDRGAALLRRRRWDGRAIFRHGVFLQPRRVLVAKRKGSPRNDRCLGYQMRRAKGRVKGN